jgi:hypothetical protein
MAKLKFTVEVGMLLRGQVKSALKNAAFMHDLTVNIEEDENFLESNLRVVFEGTDEQILALKPAIEKYFADLEKENS